MQSPLLNVPMQLNRLPHTLAVDLELFHVVTFLARLKSEDGNTR